MKKMPVIALRGLVVFPRMVTHFDCGREISVKAIEAAEMENSEIFLIAQRDIDIEHPKREDLFDIGTVAKIKQILKLPGGIVRVLVEGDGRAKLDKLYEREHLSGEVEEIVEEEIDLENVDIKAATRLVEEDLNKYSELDQKMIPGLLQSAIDSSSPASLVDTAVGYMNLEVENSQKILETLDIYNRLVTFHEIMKEELELLTIENKIDSEVKSKMNKVQKEYYLKEQLKVIHKELGEDEDEEEVTSRYEREIEEKKLPEEVEKKALKEVKKLKNTNPGSPEYTLGLNYLDWILSLPWCESKNSKIDLKKSRKVLNEEHYGLKSVKERILEFIAVKKLSKDNLKGPILCLVGPPGVGKTSIVRSISNALDKDFVRMSLGGMTDEAEIRGHRRTYIGALPGRIISLIKKAGSNDPVFLLDEIDKVGQGGFRGDPASGLLEVLDPEQNNSFTDHYLEIPFDLSKVFFIATANSIGTIPGPLLDRMEVINLSGYTPDEKYNIAKKYLVPKQIKENGLKLENISLSDKAINVFDPISKS